MATSTLARVQAARAAVAAKPVAAKPVADNRPAILVTAKDNRFGKNKTPFAILQGGEYEPVMPQNLQARIQKGLVRVEATYRSEKAKEKLAAIANGELPKYRRDWNYSINAAVGEFSAEHEGVNRDGETVTYDERRGAQAGVMCHYQDGSRLFLGLRDALFILFGERIGYKSQALNVFGAPEFDHLPFNDELGLDEDVNVCFNLGANEAPKAEAYTVEYLVRTNDIRVASVSDAKLGQLRKEGQVLSKSELEEQGLTREDAIADGWTAQTRRVSLVNMPVWWPDYMLSKVGVQISREGGRVVGFVSLMNLFAEVTGMDVAMPEVARKARQVNENRVVAVANRSR